MKSVAVFCGSSLGTSEIYKETALRLGAALAEREITLVYGGGRTGLMGLVADAALAAGGKVIGVIPEILVTKELAHPDLTELYVVQNMHERKFKMSELSDGFIAMPGGAGTLEEIFEQWTWAQLGIHLKACAFLNVDHFYDDLYSFVQGTTDKGFTNARFSDALIWEEQIDTLLDKMQSFVPPVPKWGMSQPTELVASS